MLERAQFRAAQGAPAPARSGDSGAGHGRPLVAHYPGGATVVLGGNEMGARGWRPIDRRAAIGLIADDVHLLRRVGALDRDRGGGWPGTVTTDGIALARAALADQQP